MVKVQPPVGRFVCTLLYKAGVPDSVVNIHVCVGGGGFKVFRARFSFWRGQLHR